MQPGKRRRSSSNRRQKKARSEGRGFNFKGEGGDLNILCMPGDDLLSHSVVPSAQERFTVEFEMGSSGGVPL